MDKIRSEWAAMSAEERVLATEEHMKAMTEDRATRLTGENNSGIAAFHDAISTFKSVENQVWCCRLVLLTYANILFVIAPGSLCPNWRRGTYVRCAK